MPGVAEPDAPYLSYSRYLRERHGCRVFRVAVDAGFSCPHGRCTYCTPGGARAPYLGDHACAPDLEAQVRKGIDFLRKRYGAEAFILFFQARSNTNAPVEALRRVYDAGLSLASFRGLSVATRPDCVDQARADLLASYAGRGLEVWCELGLQSAHASTLQRIHRGHTMEDFRRAFALLRERSVKVAVHLIFGLPGEGQAEIRETVEAVAALAPDGVKIHNLHVPRGTSVARELEAGELIVPSPETHLQWVMDAIERLPPSTVIMRVVCDTPKESLAAPRRFWEKQAFVAALEAAMRAGGRRQGRLAGQATQQRAGATQQRAEATR